MAQPAAALRAFPQSSPDGVKCHQLAKAGQQMFRSDGDMPAIPTASRLQRSPRLAGLTAFKPIEAGGSILVVGTIDVEALTSFTHPNWDEAMYDSEDKVLIPFEDVSGEAEIALTIEVAMSIAVNDEGDPDEIEALRFRNGDFQYVTLYPPDIYK